jgi:4'-phosphopantetheinyl transferase
MGLIKIYTRYLENISWLNSEKCNFIVNNVLVDAWRINVNSNLPALDYFLSVMHPDEIKRANKYLRINDKNRFIVSRGSLRCILGKYMGLPPHLIEFNIGENKKPYVANAGQTDLHYNISHSGDWILLAVSNSALGADVEFINHSFSYREVIDDHFSIDEAAYIRQNRSLERFFMLWTRKEALTKATGKGLDEDLKLIPALDGVNLADSSIISSSSDLIVNSFKLHDQYMASIATGNTISEIKFWDINFQ